MVWVLDAVAAAVDVLIAVAVVVVVFVNEIAVAGLWKQVAMHYTRTLV